MVVINNSTADIYVSVTTDGGDFQKGGGTSWYLLKANGGKDTWGSRANNQIVRVTRSKNAGAAIESYLGVPGRIVYIN
jgi:N-acetylmuramoyl-L-alanine amidase